MGGSGTPGYNISEKYKCLWLAPSRTGTRTMAEILRFYDFKLDGRLVYEFNHYRYTHFTPNLEPYSDYKIICGARNPYSRVLSHFKNYAHQFLDKTKENFKIYVESKGWMANNVNQPILTKVPDYLVRIENMKEDLLKIPFIFDVLNERQLDLYLLHGDKNDNWEEYYDDDIKEIVYTSFKNHFNMWGYEK